MGIKRQGAGEASKDIIISKFKDLSKEDKLEIVSNFIDDLKNFHQVSEREIFHSKEISIPIGVFSNDCLSSLEAIV